MRPPSGSKRWIFSRLTQTRRVSPSLDRGLGGEPGHQVGRRRRAGRPPRRPRPAPPARPTIAFSPSIGEVDVLVRAHRLDHVGRRLELDAPLADRVLDQRRVLEVLRAGCRRSARAGASAASSCRRIRSPSGRSPSAVRSLPSSTRRGRKFIDGEPMNPATNRLSGWSYSSCGVADLLDRAAAHDHHPVAEGHRLGLVVGDVDGGGAELLLQPGHHRAHLHPQLGVQVGQRLVHEERLRADGRSPGPSRPAAAGRRRGWPACGRAGWSAPGPSPPRRPSGRSSPCPSWPASAGTPCSPARSCSGRARTTGTPSRCRGPWAPCR